MARKYGRSTRRARCTRTSSSADASSTSKRKSTWTASCAKSTPRASRKPPGSCESRNASSRPDPVTRRRGRTSSSAPGAGGMGRSCGQCLDRRAIRPRKALRRRFLPRQPEVRQMFARIQTNLNRLRDLELEHMLGVVCRTLRIAMAPAWKDFVNIRELPVHDAAIVRRVDAGFLFQFPRRGLYQRLAVLLAAGDRLPEARKI